MRFVVTVPRCLLSHHIIHIIYDTYDIIYDTRNTSPPSRHLFSFLVELREKRGRGGLEEEEEAQINGVKPYIDICYTSI